MRVGRLDVLRWRHRRLLAWRYALHDRDGVALAGLLHEHDAIVVHSDPLLSRPLNNIAHRVWLTRVRSSWRALALCIASGQAYTPLARPSPLGRSVKGLSHVAPRQIAPSVRAGLPFPGCTGPVKLTRPADCPFCGGLCVILRRLDNIEQSRHFKPALVSRLCRWMIGPQPG